MSRTSRLFEMLGMLRTRRTPVTALELAQEFGVSERSVYRISKRFVCSEHLSTGRRASGFYCATVSSCRNLHFRPKRLTL